MAEFETLIMHIEAAIYINVVFGNWGKPFILLNRGLNLNWSYHWKGSYYCKSKWCFKYIYYWIYKWLNKIFHLD